MRRPRSVIIIGLTFLVLISLIYTFSSSTGVSSLWKRGKKKKPKYDGSCISLAQLSNAQCHEPVKKPLKTTKSLGLTCGARGTLRKPQPLYHGLGLNCSAVMVEGCYRACYAENENSGPDVCMSWSYDREKQWCEFYGASIRGQQLKLNEDDQTRRWFDRDCFEAECSQDGI